MNKKDNLFEAPIFALLMFLGIFLFSSYSLFILTKDLRPIILGNKIKAIVIEVDSLESYKKNKVYRYFGKLKFYDGDINIVRQHDFNNKQQVNDILNLYYHKKYGFYDENNNNLYVILLSIFFVSFLVTGALLWKYF